MIDTYLSIARDLFSYQELRVVLRLLEVSLWACLLVIIGAVVLHVVYLLGYQSLLYRRRSPRASWSRQFFYGASSVIVLILGTLAGLEWLNVNVVVDRAPQSVIHW